MDHSRPYRHASADPVHPALRLSPHPRSRLLPPPSPSHPINKSSLVARLLHSSNQKQKLHSLHNDKDREKNPKFQSQTLIPARHAEGARARRLDRQLQRPPHRGPARDAVPHGYVLRSGAFFSFLFFFIFLIRFSLYSGCFALRSVTGWGFLLRKIA